MGGRIERESLEKNYIFCYVDLIGGGEFFSLVYFVDIIGRGELFQSRLECERAREM